MLEVTILAGSIILVVVLAYSVILRSGSHLNRQSGNYREREKE